MVGVGVEHAIIASDQQHYYTAPERWLLVGGVALALVAVVGVEVASRPDVRASLRSRLVLSRLVAIALAIVVGAVGGLEAPATVVVLAALCGTLVLSDLVLLAPVAEDSV